MWAAGLTVAQSVLRRIHIRLLLGCRTLYSTVNNVVQYIEGVQHPMAQPGGHGDDNKALGTQRR